LLKETLSWMLSAPDQMQRCVAAAAKTSGRDGADVAAEKIAERLRDGSQ